MTIYNENDAPCVAHTDIPTDRTARAPNDRATLTDVHDRNTDGQYPPRSPIEAPYQHRNRTDVHDHISTRSDVDEHRYTRNEADDTGTETNVGRDCGDELREVIDLRSPLRSPPRSPTTSTSNVPPVTTDTARQMSAVQWAAFAVEVATRQSQSCEVVCDVPDHEENSKADRENGRLSRIEGNHSFSTHEQKRISASGRDKIEDKSLYYNSEDEGVEEESDGDQLEQLEEACGDDREREQGEDKAVTNRSSIQTRSRKRPGPIRWVSAAPRIHASRNPLGMGPGMLLMHTAIPSRCLPSKVPLVIKRLENCVGDAWKLLLSETASSLGEFSERHGVKRHSDDEVGSRFVLGRMTSYSS